MISIVRWLFSKQPTQFPGKGLSNSVIEVLVKTEETASKHWALLNDYYSWPREKKAGREHRVNTVDFLMEACHLSEDMALIMTKGLIVDMECTLRSYLADVKGLIVSESPDIGMDPEASFAFQYVQSLIEVGGGVAIWNLSSRRYRVL
jgi:hypothetical protein